MKAKPILSAVVFLTLVGLGVGHRLTIASDHDDGETETKARNLNLTDHAMWEQPSDVINLVMYTNPRGLPGYAYYFASDNDAFYEFHITRVANAASQPTGGDDVILRFAFAAPNTAGVQTGTLTVIKDGVVAASGTGATTSFAASKADSSLTTNTLSAGGGVINWFAGMREDTFFFDVTRFFQVRAFLAGLFLAEDKTTPLAPTCAGGAFNTPSGTPNLFNPASCAPDFTKNYNVSAIVAAVPIAVLQSAGETTFDSWSTISDVR